LSAVLPLIWIEPATTSQPLQPEPQLPWMSTLIMSLLGELFVSTLPDGVSTKMMPPGGGDVQVWLPW